MKKKITQASDQEIINKLELLLALEDQETHAKNIESDAYDARVEITDSKTEAFITLGKMVKVNFSGMEKDGRFIRVATGEIYKIEVDDGYEHGLCVTRLNIHE